MSLHTLDFKDSMNDPLVLKNMLSDTYKMNDGGDLLNLCRICLENESTLQIFTSNFVYSQMSLVFGEEIEDKEGYPRKICLRCYESVNVAYEFIKKYKDSCKTLQQMLRSHCDLMKTVVKIEKSDLEDFSFDENSQIETSELSTEIEEKMIENIKTEVEYAPNQDSEPTIILDNYVQENKKSNSLKSSKTKSSSKKKKYNSVPGKANIVASILEGEFNWTGQEWRLVKHKDKEKKCDQTKEKKCDQTQNVDKIQNDKTVKDEAQKSRKKRKNIYPQAPKLCGNCGKTFKGKHFGPHENRCNKIPNIQCPLCPLKFKTNHYVKNHCARVHKIGDRNFTCTVCGKQFPFLKDVNQHHKQVHTDQKRVHKTYPCQYKACGKEFKLRKQLLTHERSVHTGERPAVCTVCDARFFHEDYLKQHMRLHTGETPFKCPICNRGYAQSCNMKSHVKHRHTMADVSEALLKTLKPSILRVLRP